MEELKLTLEIDLKNKKIYIGEETGTGAEYKYANINDLADKIRNELLEMGIVLKDTREGTIYEVK